MDEYYFDYEKYKNKIKKPVKFSLSLTIFFVIILVGLCTFLCQPKTTFIEYNFVEIGQFATFSNANKAAQNLAKQGGAGFIYFDNCYHVFANFYTSKANAETVAKNIAEYYPNATQTTISAQKFNTKNSLNKQQNLAIQKQIETNEIVINTLSKLSTELDSNNITTTNLRLKISQVYDDFSTTFKENLSSFNSNQFQQHNINKYITNIFQSLSTIQSATPEELSQKIKYELIDIVINHIRFLNVFA